MVYQNKAELEVQFDEQLNCQDYFSISIPDYDAPLANFKIIFEACEQESGIRFVPYWGKLACFTEVFPKCQFKKAI
jgi:putative toxin-antitoxin system, toxin component